MIIILLQLRQIVVYHHKKYWKSILFNQKHNNKTEKYFYKNISNMKKIKKNLKQKLIKI